MRKGAFSGSIKILNAPVSMHLKAELGFSASNVSRYNNARPDYCDSGLKQCKVIINKDAKVIAEIGAGTGKFTKCFLSKYPQYVKNYIAVEPSNPFRENLSFQMPNITVIDGFGENAKGVQSSSVDCVIVAQAFHWMANEDTLLEMRRILKPNAPVILIWNTASRRVSWQYTLEHNVISPHYTDDVPRQQSYKWKDFLLSMENKTMRSYFKKDVDVSSHGINLWEEPRMIPCSAESIINRVLSTSVIACQNSAVHDKIKDDITALLKNHPETKQITNYVYDMEYITEMCWFYSK